MLGGDHPDVLNARPRKDKIRHDHDDQANEIASLRTMGDAPLDRKSQHPCARN